METLSNDVAVKIGAAEQVSRAGKREHRGENSVEAPTSS